MQTKIVHCSNAQKLHSWERLTDAIHQGAAAGTKVVGHSVSCLPTCDCVRLTEGLQVILSTEVLEVHVVYGEIGCEHRGGYLAAICAVIDERTKEAWPLGRLEGT